MRRAASASGDASGNARTRPALVLAALALLALPPLAAALPLGRVSDRAVVAAAGFPGIDAARDAPWASGPFRCDALVARRCAARGPAFLERACASFPEREAARVAAAEIAARGVGNGAGAPAAALPEAIGDRDGFARTFHLFACGEGEGEGEGEAAAGGGVRGGACAAGEGRAALLCLETSVGAEGRARHAVRIDLGPRRDARSLSSGARAGEVSCSCWERRDWVGSSEAGAGARPISAQWPLGAAADEGGQA
jgi:hypothetical protein